MNRDAPNVCFLFAVLCLLITIAVPGQPECARAAERELSAKTGTATQAR